jgi:Ran GTPase-activating protein (RanGAP) involved in mRNA processing and transport
MIVEKSSSALSVKEGGPKKDFNRTSDAANLIAFDPLSTQSSKYGRSSAIDAVRRYRLDATLEEILKDVEHVSLKNNGQFNIRKESSMSCFVIDASFLFPASVDYAMYHLDNYSDQIYGVSISQSKSLTIHGIDRVIAEILVKDRFKYLVDLNVSYLALSRCALDVLCRFVDPITAGFCPLRRILATRCSLGAKGAASLISALTQNIVVEEFFLSGNEATDSLIPKLVQFLGFRGNAVTVLGLGDNNFTEKGMSSLASAIAKHTKLKDLQLNNNPIGDNGAIHIFEAIQDQDSFESLNLNSCGISSCSWGKNLSTMLSLSSLYLAHNSISDSGLQALSLGLAETCCLRYLDLSYNEFGLTPGSGLSLGGLGSIIKMNCLLTTMILKGNNMLHAYWSSLAAGLFENETLLNLDVTYCELSQSNAESLCRALEVNQTVTIDMSYNDLPETMLEDPRKYRNKTTMISIKPKELYNNAEERSILSSEDWRIKRLAEVTTAKAATDIINIQDSNRLNRLENEYDDLDETSLLNFNSSTSILPLSESSSQGLSLGAFGHGYSVHSVKPSIDHSLSLKLAQILPPVHSSPNRGKKVITVMYGHSTTILGTIVVQDDTTYVDAKRLIKPLVWHYIGDSLGGNVSTAHIQEVLVDSSRPIEDYGNHAQPCRDYIENFTLLTPSGFPIDPNQATVRKVIILQLIIIFLCFTVLEISYDFFGISAIFCTLTLVYSYLY